jgi:hypothetical protein
MNLLTAPQNVVLPQHLERLQERVLAWYSASLHPLNQFLDAKILPSAHLERQPIVHAQRTIQVKNSPAVSRSARGTLARNNEIFRDTLGKYLSQSSADLF